jgi:hypothetical protein
MLQVLLLKTLVTLTLQQTIDYLNSKILLNFKALDNRYVTVSILNNNQYLRHCLISRIKYLLLALRSIGKSVTVTNKDGFLAFPMFLLQQF